jgi:hypothetical protein
MRKTKTSYEKGRLHDMLRLALDKLQPDGCWFCHLPFTDEDLPRTGIDLITVHHKDGNHQNNEPSNKVFVHNRCQRRYHVKDNIHSKKIQHTKKLFAEFENM